MFEKMTMKLVHQGQHGKCYLCNKAIVDFHHRLHNTKTNRKLFPLFIDSIFNCAGVCRSCHEKRKKEMDISYDMAKAYEEYLIGISQKKEVL